MGGGRFIYSDTNEVDNLALDGNWVELANGVVITLNSSPKAKLLGKSPLYYERG
eukprot:SAG11_NODE_37892_length_254_cov_6.522581_1_plen_53_part_10